MGSSYSPGVSLVAARAGLPADLTARLGPQAMRHSFATLYLDAGGSLRDLQAVMGHTDPRATRRYDRARRTPGRSPGYVVAAYLAAPACTAGRPGHGPGLAGDSPAARVTAELRRRTQR